MIISRTPFRVSFFGGGTDYPAWFEDHGGAVISTTIDKYCYMFCRYLPQFFEHKSTVIWSLIERVQNIDEIKHPSARECLKFMKISKGVEIHHNGDLPAKTGLGSSSSFTVGLLHSLYALRGQMVSKMQLAKDAISIEQEILKENVGCQDQVSAALGGFNLIEFNPGKDIQVSPVIMDKDRLTMLKKSMMLVFTGFSRIASEVAAEQIKKIPNKKKELKTMYQMVNESVKILNSNSDLSEFGKLLNESWKLKKSLSTKISTPVVDEIYSVALKSGASGGKLLGAGGGGFVLLFAEPGKQPKIKANLKKFLHVPFDFESSGSQIIFYNPQQRI